jgi:hypothetical protein
MKKRIIPGSCHTNAVNVFYYGCHAASLRCDVLGFRLVRPTPYSNTGEDEQPDNPTTHLECT